VLAKQAFIMAIKISPPAAHLMMGLIHCGSAIVLLALIWTDDWTVPLQHQFVSFNATNVPMTVTYELGSVGTLYLGRMVAAASFISGCHHFLVWKRRVSYHQLVRRVAIWRWADYTITSPLLFVVLSCLAGVYTVEPVLLLAVAQAIIIVLGALSEAMLIREQPLGARITSSIASGIQIFIFGIAWSVLYYSGPPWWVHLIYGIMACLFSSFGLLYTLHLYGIIRSRVTVDVYFTMLSAVAKVGLQWMLWSGIRARSGSTAALNAVVSTVIGGGIVVAIGFYYLVDRIDKPTATNAYMMVGQ
jgi:hypothetical protein